MTNPVPGKVVTFAYGVKGPYAAGYHTGQDYACLVGTKVVAPAKSKIVAAGWGPWGSAYGYQVVGETTFKGAKIRWATCHMSSIGVHEGMTVSEGQFLGHSGNTGNTTGPHVHYEERKSPFLYNDKDIKPVLPDQQGNPADDPKWDHGDVYVDKLHQGVKDSDTVARLRYRLENMSRLPKSHKPGSGKTYGQEVVEAVRYWQKNLMPKSVGGADVKDGSRVTNKQANHLFGKNYRVIESKTDN